MSEDLIGRLEYRGYVIGGVLDPDFHQVMLKAEPVGEGLLEIRDMITAGLRDNPDFEERFQSGVAQLKQAIDRQLG